MSTPPGATANFSAGVLIILVVGSEPPSPPPPTCAAAGAASRQTRSAASRVDENPLSLSVTAATDRSPTCELRQGSPDHGHPHLYLDQQINSVSRSQMLFKCDPWSGGILRFSIALLAIDFSRSLCDSESAGPSRGANARSGARRMLPLLKEGVEGLILSLSGRTE